jgi:hypothetical protein
MNRKESVVALVSLTGAGLITLLLVAALAGIGTQAVGASESHQREDHWRNGCRDGDECEREEDDDDKDRGRLSARLAAGSDSKEAVSYRSECGECHLAYPAELLPASSWQRLMDGLGDHFGESAELPAEQRQALTRFLTRHAAEHSHNHHARSQLRSIGEGEAPLRISETRYFRRQHDEIDPQLVLANPEVGSWSRCEACHQSATAGLYNEDQVTIPGYGRWDD